MTNLHRRALRLSYFTIGYNVVECILSILAGSLAGSIALVGFGLDSLVESLSGGVMIWRFSRHEGLSREEEERLERRAVKIVGYTFFVLGAYVLYESLKKLIWQEIPAPSLFGIGIALASVMDIFAILQFKPFDLFRCRYGHFFVGTDHLLLQLCAIPLMEKVKVNPVFLDRGMELHGHIRISKMKIPFPEGSAGHDESSAAL